MIAGFGTNYCDLTLVQEASHIVDRLIDTVDTFIFAGHSLGGTAAFCLAQKYPNSRSVSFNPGAAPTNPVTVGPGPSRARCYHIFGDLISSHMGPTAAEIIRVKKHYTFGSIEAHSTSNLIGSGPWWYASAAEENAAFQKWGRENKVLVHGVKWALYLGWIHRHINLLPPIPGS